MKRNRFNDLSIPFLQSFYESFPHCPRALTCSILLREKEYDQLARLEWNPCHYNDMVSARDALAATKIASKNNFLPLSHDKKEVALQAFKDAEDICKATNLRLIRLEFNFPDDASIINTARRKIQSMLGDFCIDSFLKGCAWGPGATFDLGRKSSTTANKFQSQTEIGLDAHALFEPVLRKAFPSWLGREGFNFSINRRNRVVTVPKNAKTDRTIAIEPGLNLFLQKGIGQLLRNSLETAGNSLKYQKRNQQLAKIGSITNRLATIDFSMASDTISLNVVKELFPKEWYLIMKSLRSEFGQLEDGSIVTYEKFSSMGNGFTFELESMIFYALAYACVDPCDRNHVSVYGDDVILPHSGVSKFLRVCETLGFTINKEKSYSSTYYRESCGSHFWNGFDITPYYLKESLTNEEALLKCANSVRRLAHRRNSYGCDLALLHCWSIVVSELRRCVKVNYISDRFGDGGLVVNFDEATPSKARFGYEGFFAKTLVETTKTIYRDDTALLLAKLYEIRDLGSGDSSNSGTLMTNPPDFWRGNVDNVPGCIKKRLVRILIPEWFDLGPWL